MSQSFSEFRRSEEFQELQLNEAIQAGIESTGIGPGQATQGGVTTQDALDLSASFREDKILHYYLLFWYPCHY